MNDVVQPLSEVTAEPFRWRWPHKLSFGSLAIIDGDPGLGKSLVAMDLCARLTTGRPFPGADTAVEPASAIILNAEDGPATALLDRLTALGADLSRIHVPRRTFLDSHGGFLLPRYTAALEQALADTGARLVVIDPIMAYLDRSVNVSCDQSVRAALAPLLRLAVQYNCVLLLIRHINKTSGTCSIYRGSSSIAFQGVCRSSWLMGRDPADGERRILAPVKNNYGPPQPALVCALRSLGKGVVVDWLGTSKLTANQVLVAAGLKADLPGALERAGDFLVEFLKDGPRTTREIWQAAQKLRMARRTLRRARDLQQISSRKTSAPRRTYWLLPGQELAGAVPLAGGLDPELRAAFKALEEMYPPDPLRESSDLN